jgi:hypothetical protein
VIPPILSHKSKNYQKGILEQLANGMSEKVLRNYSARTQFQISVRIFRNLLRVQRILLGFSVGRIEP